ncbi:MAG: hypothetical protein KDB14_19200, partial [Planctomycetales bacterium]|nr:hypothetical protein [Planctomycetales bacterium]
MGTPFRSAREVARTREAQGLWLDHAIVREDDLEWLQPIERLTLWNVRLPDGFLAKLPNLWWLDLRGGALADIRIAFGASGLKYLAVNQVRRLSDFSAITSFTQLRSLSLYGLSKVVRLPSLEGLFNLERVEVGQMKSLISLAPILDTPNLKELLLIRKVSVSGVDIHRITHHPSLQRFDWVAEDVPNRVWM